MNLAIAANYFSDTTISGWNGTLWVPNIADITITSVKRDSYSSEFSTNSTGALCAVTSTALEDYDVIKVNATDEVYLVGRTSNDVNSDRYSKFFMLHRAASECTVHQFIKTYAASGMAKNVTRQAVSNYFCSVEYSSAVESSQFKGTKFSECTIFLPRNTVIETDYEIQVGDIYYEISNVFESLGFTVCKATGKRSA